MNPEKKSPYPTNPSYPAHPGYPPQAAGYPQTAQPGYPPNASYQPYAGAPPAGPPPAYSPPGYIQPANNYPAYPAAQAYPTQHPQYPPGQPLPPAATGTYDAAARFGAGASYNIPPPPPGVVPNAAQMAQMRGQNVLMNQKKSTFWDGSGSGGYTTW